LIKEYLINDKGISESRFTINDASDKEEAINQTRPQFNVQFNVEGGEENPESAITADTKE